jgi:hypothetical protein
MTEETERKKVEARVKKMRNFYSSLITYVIVNIILIIINLVFSPHSLWFYWVSLFWGIAIVLQGINTFSIKDRFLGEEWEKKKINELMGKRKKK